MATRWRGSCEDCAHWVWDGKYGHCGLGSSDCANSIYYKGRPTRFLSWEDAVGEDGRPLVTEDDD